MLGRAVEIAIQAHKGQVDKKGLPYIYHPLAVMADPKLETEVERVVAVLHDVVEDCPGYTIETIQGAFGIGVAEAIDALTHRPSERRIDYYKRIKQNELAWKIKLADIRHNMSRISGLDEETVDRLNKKYAKALEILAPVA